MDNVLNFLKEGGENSLTELKSTIFYINLINKKKKRNFNLYTTSIIY